jgi:glycosyltransferase involved in cell wall biosynthesis
MSAPRKPRVLHVGKYYPPSVGGIETHLHALCRELAGSVDVRVLAASETGHDDNSEYEGVPVERLKPQLTIAGAPVCIAMARRIGAADADVVHLHLPNPPAVLAYLLSGHRGPLVVTWHSDIVRQRVLGAAFAPIERRILARAAAVLATSPNYVLSSRALSRHRDRCRVVPYGIDVERFRKHDSAADEIRARAGSRPIVLAVGRFVYYKGLEFLVRAMKDVDAALMLVGAGPLRPALEREARTLGIGARVIFAGEVPNDRVAPYYQAADVFALPSVARSEAFGIVQLEAMACALPVVNTRLDSGVPYVSLDGVTGLTVAPGDPEALAAALNRLLADAGLRARLGRAALERVESEFTLRRMVARTLAAYAEIGAPREANLRRAGAA